MKAHLMTVGVFVLVIVFTWLTILYPAPFIIFIISVAVGALVGLIYLTIFKFVQRILENINEK